MKKWIQQEICMRLLIVLALAVGALVMAPAHARTGGQEADLSGIRKAMIDRLEAIDALKQEGKIGENNRGLLEPRRALPRPQEALVREENEDRTLVYSVIAERTDKTVAEVGRQRAAQIAKRSQPGVWLQDAKGNWYRKPEKDAASDRDGG